MNVDAIAFLASPHPADCAVCGGKGRVRVSLLHRRDGVLRADAVSMIAWCPATSGADGLRSLLPQPTTPTDGAA